MKRAHFSGAVLIFLAILVPHSSRADDSSNYLTAYKAALERKDIDSAADYICEAAKSDPDKYGSKCISTRRAATDELSHYDKFIAEARIKFGRKDYPGAIRELKKINFGPHREEALRMIEEASKLLNHSVQPVDTGMQQLKQVQAAYESGDFATALALAPAITDANLLPITKQITTNIQIYNKSIEDGDAYMQQSQFAAAKQKYSFALVIKNNGPGDPAGKLQHISSLLNTDEKPDSQAGEADGKSTISPTPDPGMQIAKNKGAKIVKPPADNSAKLSQYFAKAQEDERKGNENAAVADYEMILTLDPQQQRAIAAKQRILDTMPKDPPQLEDTLIKGVRCYSQSQLEDARDALSLYLKEGGMQKGAAYFYLGAVFMTDALLSDTNQDKNLLRNALENFRLAKQEHFKPVEKYVSPKILMAWNKASQ